MEWPISWEDVKNSLKKKELMYEWNPGVDENGEPVYEVYEFEQTINNNDDWIFSASDFDAFKIDIEFWGKVYNEIDGESYHVPLSGIEGTYSLNILQIEMIDEEHYAACRYMEGSEIRAYICNNMRILDEQDYGLEYAENCWTIFVGTNGGDGGEYDSGLKSIRIYKVS